MKPLYDRLIVKIEPIKETTESGIILANADKYAAERDEGRIATVLAVGDGPIQEDGTCRRMHITEGAKVFIRKYGGIFVNADDEETIIIKEEDVLAII